MPVGDVGTVVPIVQIKIVQKRAAHQADFIGMAIPVQVEPVSDAGHPQAMLVGGDGAVLDELLHLQRVGVIGNAAQDLVHTCFLRRRQLANHRQPLLSLLGIPIIPRHRTISNGAGEISQLANVVHTSISLSKDVTCPYQLLMAV